MLAAAHAAPSTPCTPDVAIQQALTAYLRGDLVAAEAELGAAREAWGCGDVADRQSLTHFWLVDGAVSFASGDLVSAADALGAARSIAPELWLADLPDELRELHRTMADATGRGALLFEPSLGIREVWVDGASVVGPAAVPTGAHLVQIGDGAGHVAFADTVFVGENLTVRVVTQLPAIDAPAPEVPAVEPAPPDPPEPMPVVPTPSPSPVTVHVVAGADVTWGRALDVGGVQEPGVRVGVPLELAVGWRVSGWWARLHLGAGWLANGPVLAATELGSFSTGWRLDAHVSGARHLGPVHAGVMTGIQWPGRVALRGLVGTTALNPLFVELRGGLNLTTERPIEPSVQLVAGIAFR